MDGDTHDDAERPTKRPKTDSDEQSTEDAAPVMKEDEEVWMEDGNIVVSAGTDPIVLFRCHRFVLAKYSEVFKDMFSLPESGASATETYRNIPRVHLAGDSPEDVRDLLRMMYDVT